VAAGMAGRFLSGDGALAGLLGCGQDREGPLVVEGRLLLGHGAQQIG
jgi:hypothetical protein